MADWGPWNMTYCVDQYCSPCSPDCTMSRYRTFINEVGAMDVDSETDLCEVCWTAPTLPTTTGIRTTTSLTTVLTTSPPVSSLDWWVWLLIVLAILLIIALIFLLIYYFCLCSCFRRCCKRNRAPDTQQKANLQIVEWDAQTEAFSRIEHGEIQDRDGNWSADNQTLHEAK